MNWSKLRRGRFLLKGSSWKVDRLYLDMSEEHVGHFFVEASNPLPLERKLSGDLRVRLNGRLEKKIYFFLSPWNPSKWTNRALRKIMTKSIAHIPPSMTQHTESKCVCAHKCPSQPLKVDAITPFPKNKRKSTFLSPQVKAELLWEGHRLVRSVASRVGQRPTHL